jgi:ethanolamine ammonia-lyase small subunit
MSASDRTPASRASAPAAAPDPWTELRAFTRARIALGRSGASLPTDEVLRFGLAHAQARDAVHRALDVESLTQDLSGDGMPAIRQVRSAAPDRHTYLLRPDLGRRLRPEDAAALRADAGTAVPDLVFVLADGLSALAVQRHAAPLVRQALVMAPEGWVIGPLVIALQARVALGDAVGEALGARFVAVLIGERPGLGSPDSLGVYLTAQPRTGRMDAERNCLSNIRAEGLPIETAARKLWWLAQRARQIGGTGTQLKDESDRLLP